MDMCKNVQMTYKHFRMEWCVWPYKIGQDKVKFKIFISKCPCCMERKIYVVNKYVLHSNSKKVTSSSWLLLVLKRFLSHAT